MGNLEFISLVTYLSYQTFWVPLAFLFIFQSLNLITLFQIWGCHTTVL